MGLFGSAGNFAAQVLVEYKGDTKDLTKKMRGLKGEEKKLAKTRKEAAETANKGIEGNISMIGRATIAVGAMAAAWYGAGKAMEVWAKDSQLRGAAAGVSIDKLRKASHGLLTEQQLLKVSAAALNGQFKGTQKEIGTLVGGIAQLVHEGNDLDQVVNVLAKSVAENGVEELQQFGITVRDATGAIAVKGTQASRETLLSAMTKLDEKFTGIKGDDAVRNLNKVKDATHDLTVEIGKLSDGIADAVLNIGKNIGDLAFQMQTGDQDERAAIFGLLGLGAPIRALGQAEQGRRQMEAKARAAEADRKFWDEWTKAGSLQEQALWKKERFEAAERAGYKTFQPGFGGAVSGGVSGRWAALKKPKKGKGGRPTSPQDLMFEQFPILFELQRAISGQQEEAALAGTYAGAGRYPDIAYAQPGAGPGLGDFVSKQIGDPAQMMADLEKQQAQFYKEDKETFLSKLFGPLEDFDAYTTAFGMLTTGVDTAFGAWMAGADAGDALMAGFKEGAKLLARELMNQAKRHAAYAYGEAALQNYPKAALHAAAAAAFGGAAVFVGKGARGGGGGGSIGTAPGTYGGGGAASQPQRPLVMVFAGDYAADRQEAGARAFEAMQSYKRRNGESDIVVDG